MKVSGHLASAERASCDVLMTWNKNDFPIGEQVDGVDVREPFLFGQASIDDELPGGPPAQQGRSDGPA